ncbi:MAG: acyltransferase family protein [Phycisphaerae bacterium]
MPDAIDKNTSRNFELAKAVAILLVFTGHFGTGIGFFWVAVSIGLFVFGFSSAYFTSAKYHDSFRFGPFWERKLHRLVPDLLVINAFLLVLFIVQQRPGIWTWQTLVNVLGLNGFLNWFGLGNPSPFGRGLWFFTLLLLFYCAYPILRRVGRSRAALGITAGAALMVALLLNRYATMGHALWLTAWSFVFGVFVQRTGVRVRPVLGAIAAGLLAAVMLGLNMAFDVGVLNPCLIIAISVCAVLSLKDARLPIRVLNPLQWVSGIVIEIYFLHPYLYLRVTGYRSLDYLASLACVLAVAWLLNRAARPIRGGLRGYLHSAQA